MLRPMESDGDHFLAYYLPKEDADAEEFLRKRRTGQNVEVSQLILILEYSEF